MQLLRPESLEDAAAALGNGSVPLAGGTELVPLLRNRLVEAETLVDVRGLVPRGIGGTRVGAGTTLGLELLEECGSAELRRARDVMGRSSAGRAS